MLVDIMLGLTARYVLDFQCHSQRRAFGLRPRLSGVEKFRAWCACGGNVENRFTKEIIVPPREYVHLTLLAQVVARAAGIAILAASSL